MLQSMSLSPMSFIIDGVGVGCRDHAVVFINGGADRDRMKGRSPAGRLNGSIASLTSRIVVNPTPATGSKIKRCLDRETTEDRFECAVNEIANHADHVDKTMESIGKELGSVQKSISLLPTRDDVNAIVDTKIETRISPLKKKIDTLPSKADLAAESKKVIDAFNKKLDAEVKAIVKASDATRDALTGAFDDLAGRVATKDDLKQFATKDDLDNRFDEIKELLGKPAKKE